MPICFECRQRFVLTDADFFDLVAYGDERDVCHDCERDALLEAFPIPDQDEECEQEP